MAEITDIKYVPLSTLLGSLRNYRYNPSLIQRVLLDHLEDITKGKVDIVDPTNPFVYLLEASSVNTALAIQEYEILLRKQYPALSQSVNDLYLHMSDFDYQDRFAVPSTGNFYFYLEVNSLLRSMIPVAGEEYSKISILPNTQVTVNDITFSLQYGIDIYKYNTGVVQVKYDATRISPLQALPTNMIDYIIKVDANAVRWMVFNVPMSQFKILSTEFPVQASRTFVERIDFPDQFYVARVYYRNGINTPWIEMHTTHTDQVYDPYQPTAVLKVIGGELQVFIPPVYILNQLVKGTLRVDIYYTKGKIDINFSNFDLKTFSTRLMSIDEVADVNSFTNAMRDVSFFAYTDETIVSGSNAIDYLTLRERVIENSIGDRKLPITPTQIEYWVDRKGFNLYKNVDVITNRLFIAERDIPRSRNRYPVTPISFTTETFINTLETIKQYQFISNNDERVTIPSYTLFEVNNAQLTMLNDTQRVYLRDLPELEYLNQVNSRRLLVNPFHYVLDINNDEFDMRAYSLDYPHSDFLSFVYQNASLKLVVNTQAHKLEKKDFGYRLTITTKSGNFYKELNDDYVGVQLAFLPENEKLYGYINGTLKGRNEQGERIYQFDILTNWDVDNHDRLYLTNFHLKTNDEVYLPARLTESFILLHYTNSLTVNYVPSDTDKLLGKFLLTPDHAVITHEVLTLKFGDALHNLWRHYRSAAGGNEYARHEVDVPLYYEEDVYRKDPTTGAIFTLDDDCTITFNKIHEKGELVKDNEGNIIYKHRKGDVKLDLKGKPVMTTSVVTQHFMDLVLMDYKHYAATREDHRVYIDDVIETLTKWITKDLADVDKHLLEQTRIYFKPHKSIGTVPVIVKDGVIEYIDTLQSIDVKYYVNNSTFNDMSIRQNIEYRTVELLSEYLNKTRVSKSDIVIALKREFNDIIDTVYLKGIGGSLDLNLAMVQEEGTVLALNKTLVKQEDGKYIVKENVNIEFIDIEADQL